MSTAVVPYQPTAAAGSSGDDGDGDGSDPFTFDLTRYHGGMSEREKLLLALNNAGKSFKSSSSAHIDSSPVRKKVALNLHNAQRMQLVLSLAKQHNLITPEGANLSMPAPFSNRHLLAFHDFGHFFLNSDVSIKSGGSEANLTPSNVGYLPSLLLQASSRGTIHTDPNKCNKCSGRGGKFTECKTSSFQHPTLVTPDNPNGVLFYGACSSCYYYNKGKECSFAIAVPSTPRRTRSTAGPSSQSSSDPAVNPPSQARAGPSGTLGHCEARVIDSDVLAGNTTRKEATLFLPVPLRGGFNPNTPGNLFTLAETLQNASNAIRRLADQQAAGQNVTLPNLFRFGKPGRPFSAVTPPTHSRRSSRELTPGGSTIMEDPEEESPAAGGKAPRKK